VSTKAILRYGALALGITVAAAVATLPLATSFVDQWSRRDVELRSALVASSIRDQVSTLLAESDFGGVTELFERIAADERILAVGFCDEDSSLAAATDLLPSGFSCQDVARSEGESFSAIAPDGRQLIAAAFPVGVRGARGHLVLLHDLGFAARRSAEIRGIVLLALAGVAIGGAAIAGFVSLVIVRRWVGSLERAIDDVQSGRPNSVEVSDRTPLGAQIREVLRELAESRRTPNETRLQWSPETLRLLLARELPRAEVIVVSNREPYIHNNTEAGGVVLQNPASGLVAALEPVMRACGGTWIAHGSGSADWETADAAGRIAVPPAAPTYTLRRVWLSDTEQEGHYYGFSNEGLWPLCHLAFIRPTFREEDWRRYREVNRKFAEAVVEEAKGSDPVVLVQDYHFALLPQMIRDRLPGATIVTFWHIPWPNAESFGICPWKEDVINGLLGSSILGFHTQFHCNNFLDTIDRFIESRIDREHDVVTFGGHDTLVRPYPISIEWPPKALAEQPPVAECRENVRRRLGLNPDMRLGVGVERFDYTKGILDRMRAVDALLADHPEWKGRFTFVQVAAPTRSRLPAYQQLQKEADELAQEINSRHRAGGYAPIILLVRHHEPAEVFELFRASDLCIVSSLHDGMNLVAKEYVASRDDEEGVLILSSFTGASRELSEALIVNPYDAHAVGESIRRALEMPKAEQQARMRLMRDLVRDRNVYRWAGEMLLDSAKLRQRSKILRLVSHTKPAPPEGRDSLKRRSAKLLRI
jgi:trehalose 6-phosphate synthase